jgi:iron complex transport system substrate-binding protein
MRIVTMIPSHTETVCALKACEKLVGIDEYSNFPAEVASLAVMGSAFSPNIEAIVALEPDLILIDESSGLAEMLRDLGLNVYAGTAQTYDEVFEKFSVLGALINRETEAAILKGEIQGSIVAIEALVAKLEAKSVYFEIDATPYSVGPNSFIGILLAKAGGTNIVEAGMGDFPQLDPEFVVAANPEVIMLADAPYGESLATLALRAGWDSLTALETGSVFEMSQEQVDITNRPGPRIAEAVEILAQLIHGIY